MPELDDVDVTLSIVDGRVAMSADGEASLHVEIPPHRPLSAAETHATLRFVGDDYRVEVDLNATERDMLQDALGMVPGGDGGADRGE